MKCADHVSVIDVKVGNVCYLSNGKGFHKKLQEKWRLHD